MEFLQTLKIIMPIFVYVCYESEVVLQTSIHYLHITLFCLKYHFKYQYNLFSCISGVDNIFSKYNFSFVYEMLSVNFSNRRGLNIIIRVFSIENTFINASQLKIKSIGKMLLKIEKLNQKLEGCMLKLLRRFKGAICKFIKIVKHTLNSNFDYEIVFVLLVLCSFFSDDLIFFAMLMDDGDYKKYKKNKKRKEDFEDFVLLFFFAVGYYFGRVYLDKYF